MERQVDCQVRVRTMERIAVKTMREEVRTANRVGRR